MMKHFIYPAVLNIPTFSGLNLTKNVMIFPFYFPRLPGEEYAYQEWQYIDDIPRNWMHGTSEYITAKPFDCEVRSVGSAVNLYALHEVAWTSPNVENFNAYVLYKKKSGKLILFNTLSIMDETISTCDGTLTITYEGRPIITLDF